MSSNTCEWFVKRKKKKKKINKLSLKKRYQQRIAIKRREKTKTIKKKKNLRIKPLEKEKERFVPFLPCVDNRVRFNYRSSKINWSCKTINESYPSSPLSTNLIKTNHIITYIINLFQSFKLQIQAQDSKIKNLKDRYMRSN